MVPTVMGHGATEAGRELLNERAVLGGSVPLWLNQVRLATEALRHGEIAAGGRGALSLSVFVATGLTGVSTTAGARSCESTHVSNPCTADLEPCRFARYRRWRGWSGVFLPLSARSASSAVKNASVRALVAASPRWVSVVKERSGVASPAGARSCGPARAPLVAP